MGRAASSRKPAQALVELALVLPVMLLLLLALVDFGRAYYTSVALSGAAREGVRYLAANRCPFSCTTMDATARTRVLSAIGQNMPAVVSTGETPTLPACSTDPPPDTGKPCMAIANFDANSASSAIRNEGYGVRIRFYADIELYSAFLAEGFAGLAPGIGLCYTSGTTRVCRIPVQVDAYMVVL